MGVPEFNDTNFELKIALLETHDQFDLSTISRTLEVSDPDHVTQPISKHDPL